MKPFFSRSITGHRGFTVVLMLLMFGHILAGCEKSDQHTKPTQQTVKKYDQAAILQGLVSNKDGVINAGYIEATDSKGRSLARTGLQNNGRYQLEISANTMLPIVLTFYPGSDKAALQKLIAVAVDPDITQYDLNPLTTAIAKKAEALGGYTRANMVIAAESTISAPEENKTSTGFRGDPTRQYGGWH